MFQTLRYYSTIFVLVVLVIIGVFMVYAKYTGTKTIVQNTAVQHAELTEKYFQRQIWERYFPIVNFISSIDDKNIGSIPAAVMLQDELSDFFQRPEIADAVLVDGDRIVFELLSKHKLSDFDTVDFDTVDASNTIAKTKLKNGKYKYLLKTMYLPTLIDLPDSYKQFSAELDPKLFVFYDVDDEMRKLNNILIISSILFGVVLVFILIYIYIYSMRTEKMLAKGGVGVLQKEGDTSTVANYEEKAKFYDNINHELRTPLNAIIGFSELVKNESVGSIDNPQYKDFAQNIYEAGNQMLMLIDDIQDFAKAGENKLQIENEPMDLTKIAHLCMQMVEGSAAESGIDLLDEMGDERYVIKADPRRMKQVILNLLTNSIKFTKKGGNISLSFKFADNKISLEIKDTGEGMSPDDLKNALTPFGGASEEQDGIKVQKKESTGLGLPLTKKLIELMGGEFDITSELNLGTKIRLIFASIDEDTDAPDTDSKAELTLVEEERAKAKDKKKLEEVLQKEKKKTIEDKATDEETPPKEEEQIEDAPKTEKEEEKEVEEKEVEDSDFKFVDDDHKDDKDK